VNLSSKLRSLFESGVRARGAAYHAEGRVRIGHHSSRTVEATVQGSRRYQVGIEWDGESVLSVSCECAYFDSSGPCKHLWATVLEADARGYLPTVAAAQRITLDDDLGAPSDEFEGVDEEQDLPPSPFAPAKRRSPQPAIPAWQKQITEISDRGRQLEGGAAPWPAKREVVYIIELPSRREGGSIAVTVATRDRRLNGTWTHPSASRMKFSTISQMPLAEDREVVSALAGGAQYLGYDYSMDYATISSSFLLTYPLARSVLPRALRTGRCYMRAGGKGDHLAPLSWDEGSPWRFKLVLARAESRGWLASGVLYREAERMDLAAPVHITRGGFVITQGRVALLAEDAPFEWLVHFRQAGFIGVPEKDAEEFLSALLSAPNLPELEVPKELRYQEMTLQPRPCLRIHAPDGYRRSGQKLNAELSFDYAGKLVAGADPIRGFYQAGERRFLRRDTKGEREAEDLLDRLGIRRRAPSRWEPSPPWELGSAKLPRVVCALVEAGWHIEAEGKVFRRPGSFRLNVATGVDWFELHGEVEYGGSSARLPELLEAVRRGEKMVCLDDGTYGLLPEEWLDRIGALAGMGTPEDGHLRFRRSQAGLLDALLAAQPEACCDEAFARVRGELGRFDGVQPAEQPKGFEGRLRDYQRVGLGWMEFLRRFSFGGCLADDMGVGKTAQVLALLETRRERRAAGEPLGPSLVVAPRSLVFNWKLEAARFTPRLRVLDHTGAGRGNAAVASADLVLTTYGTLRRDAPRLAKIEFDYVVLDEAQAVKNPATDAAKAARLLRGNHRLALSGTPVENHLGELWSLFEFLNPGMLGAASVFKMASGAMRNPGEETRRLLARALRPFILRRTKEQVAPELPSKTEQTVFCEMDSGQRRLYDELRRHYRSALLKRIDDAGLAKSKIQVLEALLRLRQAACHPGLIDPGRRGESSAKLEALMEELRVVLDEGHKALVFSQFTSLLRIVRDRLENEAIGYEYLDGATRDRQAPVERFQNNADSRLFLISLKAGGLGLNLTAAEYVFLLDPWWNPAVEAQAVDRAHRIGQTRPIFAYRLLARDTVEEKVLELQQTKRDLAAAIFNAENSLIRDLRREDLELLLS
jgi:hypothetical protein